jgi:CRP/FNR family transcriptional regulator, cyclic AMP receptor protein
VLELPQGKGGVRTDGRVRIGESSHERREGTTIRNFDERVCRRPACSRPVRLERLDQAGDVALPLHPFDPRRKELEHRRDSLTVAGEQIGAASLTGSRARAENRTVVGPRRAKALKAIPLFARCSRRQLADIAAIAYEKEFPAGSELIREGGAGDSFFVLLEGTADVSAEGEKLRDLAAGDFFGEIALLAHSSRTASVVTTSPARAIVVPGRRFRSLLGRQPEVQLVVLEALVQRARTAAV